MFGLSEFGEDMRVAICQVDGKWPNLALAKIAAHHHNNGDTVEWFMPLMQYDLVYASKIFLDTPDNPYLPPFAIVGGSGHRKKPLWITLHPAIDDERPDFSFWPQWNKSMGFTTRGCVRRCPFCVVPEKEGKLRVVAEFGDLWNGRSSGLVLLDNNLTAAPVGHLRKLADDARAADVLLEHAQFDARLLTEEQAQIIVTGPFERLVHFAFDNMDDEVAVRRCVALMTDAGSHPNRLMFYVLVGFDTTPEQDMYRIDLLTSLGVNPFVMPFDRHDRYQRNLARWCNSVVARKTCTFEEYRP